MINIVVNSDGNIVVDYTWTVFHGYVCIYSDGHRLRTCFGKFNINFEPRATLDLEPKTIHLEPLIILNDISLCSIYV